MRKSIGTIIIIVAALSYFGYIKHTGADANKTITIDGGNLRDITIHQPKTAQRAAQSAQGGE